MLSVRKGRNARKSLQLKNLIFAFCRSGRRWQNIYWCNRLPVFGYFGTGWIITTLLRSFTEHITRELFGFFVLLKTILPRPRSAFTMYPLNFLSKALSRTVLRSWNQRDIVKSKKLVLRINTYPSKAWYRVKKVVSETQLHLYRLFTKLH